MQMKNEIRIALLWPLLYILGMGLSNYIVHHRFYMEYGSVGYVSSMLPFLAALAAGTLLCFLIQKKKLAVPWKERGRLPLFLIMFLPLSAMAIYYMVKNGSMTYAFAAPAAATLLVGVAEETMFRRILYIRLLRLFRYQSFKKPLLISALLFSLLHAVNYFAGFPAQQVLMQLVTTFVAGLFYILMYDYTKNIYLMILMHFLWDYILLSGATKQIPVFGTAMWVLEVIQIIVLLVLLYRKWKQIAKEAAT